MFNPFLTLGFQILSFCHMLLAFYFKIVEMFTYVYLIFLTARQRDVG